MSAAHRISTLACIAAAAVLATTAFGLSRPDGLIERSYAEAFEGLGERNASPAFDPAHLHLSSLPASTGLGTALAVGDRISLAQRAGGNSSYEIIDIRPMPGVIRSSAEASSPRLMLVTAISSGQLPLQTIRFIVDADAPAASIPGAKPHAL